MRKSSLILIVLALVAPVTVQAEILGPAVTLLRTDAWVTSDQPMQDIGTFSIKIRVTNPDENQGIFINRYPPESAASFRRNGVQVPDSTFHLIDDLNATSFEVWPWESGNFTATGVITPSQSGIYFFELNQLWWGTSRNGPWNCLELGDDFRTNYISLQGTPEPATALLLLAGLPLLRRHSR